MLTARVFREGFPPTDAAEADWAKVCTDDTNTLWIDLENPSEEEWSRVAEAVCLDPRAVAMAREPNRQAAVRFFGDQILVTSLAVDVDETTERPRSYVEELDALTTRNCLVTYHERPLPFAAELTARTATNPRLGRFDATYLLYAVLDTQVGHFTQQVEEIEDRVRRLEDRLLRDPSGRSIVEALVIRRHLQRVRRLIAPHREALGALVAADSPIEEEHVENYFRDLLGRLATTIQRLDQIGDAVTGAYTIYVSSLTNRTNQQLRVLTYLSAVLLPVTAITGIFGTNFTMKEYELWEPFYVMLAGIGAIVAGMLAFFRHRRWL